MIWGPEPASEPGGAGDDRRLSARHPSGAPPPLGWLRRRANGRLDSRPAVDRPRPHAAGADLRLSRLCALPELQLPQFVVLAIDGVALPVLRCPAEGVIWEIGPRPVLLL